MTRTPPKTKKRKASLDPVRHYAEEVLNGGIVAGPYVRLAGERHLVDLRDGGRRGLRYDRDLAQVAFDFCGMLNLPEGDPFDLLSWQQFVVGNLLAWLGPDGYRRFRTAYLESSKGSGKSPLLGFIALYGLFVDDEQLPEIYAAAPLSLDTPVPTPNGWTTQGQLKVGDEVYSPNGQACTVTYLSPIIDDNDCYEVVFDDGTVIVSDGNHRWFTEDTRGQRPGIYKPAVVTTKQIAATLRSPSNRLRHRIPVAEALISEPAVLPIDPYTLGVWLGDGNSRRGSITHDKKDCETILRIRSKGYIISEMKPCGNTCHTTIRGLRTQLRKAGLLRNKHVPGIYLRSSAEQRQALLQGLMDTDGTCTKTGECRFTNRNKQIAESVHELATGLGIRASLRSCTVTGRPHWIVNFKAPQSLPVFLLERKRVRQVSKVDARAKGRYICDVRPCKSVPVKCIEVDSPDHLYLVTRSHIATHNTKREQAKICWNDGANIAKNSEALEGRYQLFVNNLFCPENGGFFRPISADVKLSGPRPHIVLIDELHEHPNDKVVSMLRAGFKRRRQPLMVEMTNTPHSEHTICGKHRDYSIKVLKQVYQNDQWFAYVCSLDEGDDWKNEAVWEKANPSLGTVVSVKYLRERVQEAEGIRDQEDEVKRLNFCIMSSGSKRAINLNQWDKANPPVLVAPEQRASEYRAWAESLRGRECFGGLDLGKVSDLSCYNLFFPPTEKFPRPAWLAWYWCPEEDIVARSRAGVPYDVWARLGWITATEGNVTDFDFVQAEILKLHGLYKIVRTAYDRTFAGEIVQHLQDEGCDMLDFGQGFVSMTTPSEYLLRYIKGAELDHGSHPITRWCAENLVNARDPAGNLKPDKERSPEKIDGISAGLMSIGAWLDKRPKRSMEVGGCEVW